MNIQGANSLLLVKKIRNIQGDKVSTAYEQIQMKIKGTNSLLLVNKFY